MKPKLMERLLSETKPKNQLAESGSDSFVVITDEGEGHCVAVKAANFEEAAQKAFAHIQKVDPNYKGVTAEDFVYDIEEGGSVVCYGPFKSFTSME